MSDDELALDDWAIGDTVASNPGRTAVQPLRWLVHYPFWPVVWTLTSTLPLLLLFSDVPLLFLMGIPFWAALALYWSRIRTHFRFGDANPGYVVSVSPVLVAVRTDLSKGIGEYPVVKVVRVPIKNVRGEPAKVGHKIATVSLYGDDPNLNLPHWVDFNPIPVDCATADVEKQKSVLRTFHSSDWSELKNAIKSLPKPFRPGMYPIGWRAKKLVGYRA